MKDNAYNSIMQSNAFINFQEQLLMEYYGNKYFTYVFNKLMQVYCVKGADISYPFNGLKLHTYSNDKQLKYTDSKYYNEYRDIVSKNIHRPDLIGYMLDRFDFNKDGEITGIHTWTGTYTENVYTSHILEYEVYKAYLEYRSTHKVDTYNLVLRNAIHKDGIESSLRSGNNRASLLGVQMLVVFLDAETQKYQTLVIKRSNDVLNKPGFYQFVPSGGFEAVDNNCVAESYNLMSAIFREYLEEVILGQVNDYETVNGIMKESAVRQIIEYLDNGSADFKFLGSVTDLCGLRHELSFVLIIHDDTFSKNVFKSNSESKEILRMNISDVESLIPAEKINPGSAGLWYLFKTSDLYDTIE